MLTLQGTSGAEHRDKRFEVQGLGCFRFRLYRVGFGGYQGREVGRPKHKP